MHQYKTCSVTPVHSLQIASKALGIPTSKIRLHDTSTDKVPNSILTGASSTTMLNGSAVLVCTQIP